MSLPARLCLFIALIALPAAAQAQVYGCTDPAAVNYQPSATRNDGSCTYPGTTIAATQVAQLSDTVQETSGLVYWNGFFWTHNDDTDTTLYALDTADGHIVKRIAIAGAPNHDWEELTQDNDYFYLGDFGNNAQGNRQNLVILRIAKTALLAGQTTITPDKIFFSYADQTSFAATGNNNTDFDCEAFLATTDSLYLFTKQWVSGKTKIYALPKMPGTYTAMPQAAYNVDGLVTGATYLSAKKTIVLTGYKISGLQFQPFLMLLYDFPDLQHLLNGNKRKVLLNPQYHQTEAIATTDGSHFYITNERLTQGIITIPPKLQKADLSGLLAPYYTSLKMPFIGPAAHTITFYPNPAKDHFTAKLDAQKSGVLEAYLYDALGRAVRFKTQALNPGSNEVRFAKGNNRAGIYWIKLLWEGQVAWGSISLND